MPGPPAVKDKGYGRPHAVAQRKSDCSTGVVFVRVARSGNGQRLQRFVHTTPEVTVLWASANSAWNSIRGRPKRQRIIAILHTHERSPDSCGVRAFRCVDLPLVHGTLKLPSATFKFKSSSYHKRQNEAVATSSLGSCCPGMRPLEAWVNLEICSFCQRYCPQSTPSGSR